MGDEKSAMVGASVLRDVSSGAQERKAKFWSDGEIIALAGREMLGFEDWPAALASVRERWALFEKLRELDGDAKWADLPSQEAFEGQSRAAFERALSQGLLFTRSGDPLPAQSVESTASCAPVGAAGQQSLAKQADVSRDGFRFVPCGLGARAGDTALAELAWAAGLAETARRVARGEWSAKALRASFEAKAARVDGRLGSLERICAVPKEIGGTFEGGAESKGFALAGIPFAAKSLFWVEGECASASSAMLSKFKAPIDAPVVAGLRAAGAVPIAMARMDEFAMGGDGSRSAWGPTKHPQFEDRLPGGSSSGSAAALAAGLCMFSIGSDTGGSVRIPASYCGLWGFKPTYGALSRFGMVPYAFSLDCPGAFARTARDLATVYEAMASGPCGWDERQRLWEPKGFARRVEAMAKSMGESSRPWAGMKIGVERAMVAGCDVEAREAFAAWEAKAVAAGADVVDVSLPSGEKSVWAYYLLASCEAQSSLARYDPIRFGWMEQAEKYPDWESACVAARKGLMGLEPRLRALAGAMALSEPSRESIYAKACSLRAAISSEWASCFDAVDVVCMPTTSGPPPAAGVALSAESEWAQDRLAIPASLGGIGAISAPWCERTDGFPMGVQLCYPWHGEAKALAACIAMGR